MNGIVVRYEYAGDEGKWRAAMGAFVAAVAADDAVRGRFRYAITRQRGGAVRTHMGRWDSEETLRTVQSRDYFKTFAAAVQEFGGASVTTTPMEVVESTD